MSALKLIAESWIVSFNTEALRNTHITQSFKPFVLIFLRLRKKVPWKVRLIILVTGFIPEDYIEGKE